MAAKYFESVHVLIYANYIRGFLFHLSIQSNIFYSEQNYTMHFVISAS